MIHFLVFFSGAVLMSLEILGSRILAPSYGNSIFVWGSLIGVFLAALSAGYWFGGMMADARPTLSGLAVILLLSGVLVCMIPMFSVTAMRLAGDGPRSGPLLAALALFGLPSVLMGAVSPYAIRIRGAASTELGRAAGTLYAVSTLGSIVGTIGTAFWLIPLTGVDTLVRILGLTLVTLGGSALFAAGIRVVAALVMVASLTGVVLTASHGIRTQSGSASVERKRVAGESGRFGGPEEVLYRADSLYHRIRVTREGDVRYLRFDNSWQGAADLSDPNRGVLAYTDYFHLAFGLRPGIRDVLMIGLGAGTAPKQFRLQHPEVRIDVAEIDPEVIRVAHRFFGVPVDPRVAIYAMDGRKFVERTARRYDLVLIDAYYSDSIPFHLATLEFLELLKSRLKPDGIIAANIVGAVTGPQSALPSSVYETVGRVFQERYLFAVELSEEKRTPMKQKLEQSRNLMLFAGNGRQLSRDRLLAKMESEAGKKLKSRYTALAEDLVDGPELTHAKILSDDYAPVDNLMKFGE